MNIVAIIVTFIILVGVIFLFSSQRESLGGGRPGMGGPGRPGMGGPGRPGMGGPGRPGMGGPGRPGMGHWGGGGRPWNWPWNIRQPYPGPFWPWAVDSPYEYTELPVYPYVYRDPVIPVDRFAIRVGPKTRDHPFYGRGSSLGFTISQGMGQQCGTSGARLDLEYGRAYEFQVLTDTDCTTGQTRDQPFFFTTSPEGGNASGAIFNVTPTKNGIVRVMMTNDLPRQFFYQSTVDKNVGGYVFLHNQ